MIVSANWAQGFKTMGYSVNFEFDVHTNALFLDLNSDHFVLKTRCLNDMVSHNEKIISLPFRFLIVFNL